MWKLLRWIVRFFTPTKPEVHECHNVADVVVEPAVVIPPSPEPEPVTEPEP